MKPPLEPLRRFADRRRDWPLAGFWRAVAGMLLLGALLFLAWPYWTLWRIDQALQSGRPGALAGFVDLDAVRDQIRRRLNKDSDSAIGEVSGFFIEWIEQGLRETGQRALDTRVTIDWLRQRLLDRAHAAGGLLSAIDHAFFDPPHGFLVRLGDGREPPLYLLLRPAPVAWRIVAVYY